MLDEFIKQVTKTLTVFKGVQCYETVNNNMTVRMTRRSHITQSVKIHLKYIYNKENELTIKTAL